MPILFDVLNGRIQHVFDIHMCTMNKADEKCFVSAEIVTFLMNSLWPKWRLMATYCVNIVSGNGLLPDGTKPLPEPIMTNDQ